MRKTTLRPHRPRTLSIWLALALLALEAHALTIPESLYQEMQWRMIGPYRGGRTRAGMGVRSQLGVFYIGVVNGGVWKTDDFGRTWKPIFDSQPVQSIGAIAVAPSDPNILYVASGEGLQRPDLSIGNGIYRSNDGGKRWTHLGLADSQQIPALAIDPHDPDRVFAGVLGHPYGPNRERGVFRTTDAGKTWTKVLYKDENTGACDVEIDPSDPQVIYATLWRGRQGPWEDANAYGGAGGGIYKSTDGGDTWHQLAGGLPDELMQAHIAIAPNNNKRIYAMVAAGHEKLTYGSGRGVLLFRSDDAGASWHVATHDTRPTARIGGGDLPVPKVDPTNPDIIYSASIVTWRSIDAGKSWKAIRGAPGGDDYQNLWINPDHPQIILLAGDQGAIITTNGGETWSSWYNQPTAQLYHVITDNQFPYRVYGAQQESGSVGITSRGNDGQITVRQWHPVGAIEYGYIAPDPLDPNIVYGAGRTEVSRFDWNTGQAQDVSPVPVKEAQIRADRTEPIIFSPVDPHVLYYATNLLFQTSDGGKSWQTISPDLTRERPGIPASLGQLADSDPHAAKVRGAIYALAPSFHALGTLWAGTDDGLVWITRDGGKNWTNITPSQLTPWSKVTQIAASHFDDDTAYVSVSRFRIDGLHPHIFRTHDGGKSWQPIVRGLPEDAPVNTVREDPIRKGLLFCGTERAVWVSFNDGELWQSLQQNLPHTSMRDLWIHESDLLVATHGRSFWILDDISPLRQITGDFAQSSIQLCKPAAAWCVQRDTNTDTPLPPDEPAARNPPDGAILDYYLARNSDGPVTLEILDAQSHLVRRYSSADATEPADDELSKSISIPLYWVARPRVLPATAGMHRWVWDLHYTAPVSIQRQYPISAIAHDTPHLPLGPLALPGTYTVRLSADGQNVSQPLLIKLDPRLQTPPSDLQSQFDAQQRLASMMSRSSQAQGLARSLQTQAAKIAGDKTNPLATEARTLTTKLGQLLAPASSNDDNLGLAATNAQISSLYAQTQKADAAPTAPQSAALERLEGALANALKVWKQIDEMDLPAFNTRLRAAGLSEIHPKWDPQAQVDSQDED